MISFVAKCSCAMFNSPARQHSPICRASGEMNFCRAAGEPSSVGAAIEHALQPRAVEVADRGQRLRDACSERLGIRRTFPGQARRAPGRLLHEAPQLRQPRLRDLADAVAGLRGLAQQTQPLDILFCVEPAIVRGARRV